MVEIIAGEKGGGKTKHLLDKSTEQFPVLMKYRISGQEPETHVRAS